MVKGKKIIITGGAGFIGSHVAERLIKDNQIKIYDIGLHDSLKFSSGLLNHDNLIIIKGDVRDKDLLIKESKGYNIFLHMAAIAGVSSHYNNPLKTMDVNLFGSYYALSSAKENNLELFIDFSTSEVFGKKANNVKEEDDTSQGEIKDRRWTYAISKLASESLSYCFEHSYGLPIVVVRPFNVYGPRQTGEGAIADFMRAAISDECIKITGDGSSIRSWCYVDDFVDCLIKVMYNQRAIGEVFNIGNSQAAINTKDLAEKIIAITGSKSKIQFRPHPGTDISIRVPNTDKANKLLGYNPRISLDEGLKRTYKFFSENL